jgi:type IV pilus assembly PilN-like protein
LTNIMQKSVTELKKMQVPTILFDDSDAKASKNKKRKKPGKNSEPKEFLQISGHALEDQAVARFVERLEEISYFKMVFLFKTEQTLVGKTPVREFTIYCYMPAKPDKTVT